MCGNSEYSLGAREITKSFALSGKVKYPDGMSCEERGGVFALK